MFIKKDEDEMKKRHHFQTHLLPGLNDTPRHETTYIALFLTSCPNFLVQGFNN